MSRIHRILRLKSCVSPGSFVGKIVSLSEFVLIFERNKGTLVMVLAVLLSETLCVNFVFRFPTLGSFDYRQCLF